MGRIIHQYTKKDIEEMEAEIDRRKNVERPKLLESLKEARAQGDLSDNFEYYVAKREKNRNESRIRYLDRIIRTADIIEDTAAEDEAGIEDEVTLYFEEDDECETFTLLTTKGSDSLNNRISIESPIGKAIYKKKVGDRVQVTVNRDNSFYVVIRQIVKH